MIDVEKSKPEFHAESFTQTGFAHMKENRECEDVCAISEQNNMLFYGLADGQSGKKYCRIGGEAVLSEIARYIAERGVQCLSQYEYVDEIQYEIIKAVRKRLELLAADSSSEITEYSSTLLALVIDPETDDYIVIHLGDGGIIGDGIDGSIKLVSAPENGITSKYTWLTTSERALLHLRISFGKMSNYKRMIMFTDGADAIAHGANISMAMRKLLKERGDTCQIAHIVERSEPVDDASFIVIDRKSEGSSN
ncbi:MAG: protein phosphatase 2C domain-containing protein [Oscillospiraceae bacterium]|nr:protein phosphatase 2C domain-containing protein [Oscillospiraceae bacterium]